MSNQPNIEGDSPGPRQCAFYETRSVVPYQQDLPAHIFRRAKLRHRAPVVPEPRSTPIESRNTIWRCLGPYALYSGNWGALSGRVTGIAFGPKQPSGSQPRTYIATANGGVWHSDDGGRHWRTFNDYPASGQEEPVYLAANADLLACGALAVSPDGQTIVVGTGEGNRYAAPCQLPYEGYSYEGIGPVVSTDGGTTWQIEPSEPDLIGHAFFTLAIDPHNPQTIVAGTSTGLYVREKVGSNFIWRKKSLGSPNAKSQSLSSVVATSKNNKTTFYAAIWGDKVYQSSDGGATWSSVAGPSFPRQKTVNTKTVTVGRIGLAAQPGNPDMLYALIADFEESNLFGIYRIDKGAVPPPSWSTWQPVDAGSSSSLSRGLVRGWWNMAFAVDPNNDKRLYLGMVELFSADVNIDAQKKMSLKNVASINSVHTDLHALAFQPIAGGKGKLDSDKLWVGCDGGIYASESATDQKPTYFSRNVGLPTMLMEAIGQHPSQDAILYCGTQDNYGQRYTGDPVWYAKVGGDCGGFVVNWNQPDELLSTYIGGRITYHKLAKAENRSVPGYTAFSDIVKNTYSKTPAALVYAPLVGTPYNPASPIEANRVAFGENRVWISNNFAKTWHKSNALAMAGTAQGRPNAGDRIKSLTFASYTKLYAGTMDGQIHRFDEAGSTWTDTRVDIPNAGYKIPPPSGLPVTSIAVDPADATGNSIYVTYGGQGACHVWYFNGSTQSWEMRSGPNPLSLPQQANKILSPATTQHELSLTAFAGKLYLAYVDDQGGIQLTSSNDGSVWSKATHILATDTTNHGIAMTDFSHGGVEKLFLCFVGQDNLVYVASSKDGNTWQKTKASISGSRVTPHPVSCIVFKDDLFVSVVGDDQKVYLISSSDGNTWTPMHTIPTSGVDATAQTATMAVYRDQLHITFYLGPIAYTASTADGKSWSRMTGSGVAVGLTGAASIIAYNHMLYAFFSQSVVRGHSTHDGVIWPDSRTDPRSVTTSWQSSHTPAVDIFKDRLYLAYVGNDGGIYLAADQDRNPTALPDVQHNTIAVDPHDHQHLYAGNDIGVYYSTDAGDTWRPFMHGLPEVGVIDMKIYPPAGPFGQAVPSASLPSGGSTIPLLRVSTYGHSLFERVLRSGYKNNSMQLYVRKNMLDRGLYDVQGTAELQQLKDAEGKAISLLYSPDIKLVESHSGDFQDVFQQKIHDKQIFSGGNFSATFYQFHHVKEANSKYSASSKYAVFVQVNNNSTSWSGFTIYLLASWKVKESPLPDLPVDGFNKSNLSNSTLGSWTRLQTKSLSQAELQALRPDLPLVVGFDVTSDFASHKSGTHCLLVLVDDGSNGGLFKATNLETLCRTNRRVAIKFVRLT